MTKQKCIELGIRIGVMFMANDCQPDEHIEEEVQQQLQRYRNIIASGDIDKRWWLSEEERERMKKAAVKV